MKQPEMRPFITKEQQENIQAFILRCYYDLDCRHFLLQVQDPRLAGLFLAEIVRPLDPNKPDDFRVTSLFDWDHLPGITGKPLAYALQIGLTYEGLKKLGVDDVDAIFQSFPSFRKGLLKAAKNYQFVDNAFGNPEIWSQLFREGEVDNIDIFISLYAPTENLRGLVSRFEKFLDRDWGLKLLNHSSPWEYQRHGNDQFGYKDPISQPQVKGDYRKQRYPSPQPRVPDWTMFLKDVKRAVYNLKPFRDDSKKNEHAQKLLLNGSFSAFQVFEMRVRAFKAYLNTASAATGYSPDLIAAKMVGRWYNGTPLVLSPDKEIELPDDQINNFNYNPMDMDGYRCPLGAHMRRGNPRGSLSAGNVDIRRLMRAAGSYGPPFLENAPEDGVQRGLVGHFICSMLSQQFEFLLTEWLNRGDSFGLPALSTDPIMGANNFNTIQATRANADARMHDDPGTVQAVDDNGEQRKEERTGTLIIEQPDGKTFELAKIPRFVVPRGGVYLFLPSRTGIEFVAEIAQSQSRRAPA